MARATVYTTAMSAFNGQAQAASIGKPDGLTAIGTATTAALANGTISGDGTALGLVTAIQTAQQACLADVYVSFNQATIATQAQLKAAFAQALAYALASGLVTE